MPHQPYLRDLNSAAVAAHPEGQFEYPVGIDSLVRLAYAPEWLSEISPELTARFVGVGNPFHVRLPREGERVLDVGCGCGVDTYVAARLVGRRGRAVGLDASPEMLAWPHHLATGAATECLPEFVEGSAERLPFEDASFDVVISNGVLNLVVDKDQAFSEIRRVLAPGGALAAADLVVREAIPPELLGSMDAWST